MKKLKNILLKRLIVDHCLVILTIFVTVGLAEAIPHFNKFVALIGAVGSAALALIFPPILEIILVVENATLTRRLKFTLVKDVLILLIGIFGMVTATYYSTYDVVMVIKKDIDYYQNANSTGSN